MFELYFGALILTLYILPRTAVISKTVLFCVELHVKARSTPATVEATGNKVPVASTMLLWHCCWCGPGL